MHFKSWTKDLNRHSIKENVQLTTKHMNKHSTSLVIEEVQIQTRIPVYPMRVAKIKKADHTKHWEGCDPKLTDITGWSIKCPNHFGKRFDVFFQSLA